MLKLINRLHLTLTSSSAVWLMDSFVKRSTTSLMMRLITLLTIFLTCHSTQVCGAAEAAKNDFNQLVKQGRYLDADKLASVRLKKVEEEPDFQNSDVVVRYLQAARSAQIWARWNEAERLLATLESGLHKAAVPESNTLWQELHTQQIELLTEMASYSLADATYNKARSKTAKHKREDAPSFNSLLAAQANSLRMQQRSWEASIILEERLRWLRRFEASNQRIIGLVMTELGEVNRSIGRLLESNKWFTQAKPLLESAYRSETKDRAAAIQALSHWAFEAYSLDRLDWEHCKLRSELIETLETIQGKDSPLLVIPLIGAAAYCEDSLGDRRATVMYERALKVATDTWGASHPRVLDVLNMQGTFFASREYSERLNEKGRQIQRTELEMRRRVYAEAPSVYWIADLFRMSDNPPDSCTEFASGQCKKKILELLNHLSLAWGDKHPALAAARTYMVVRIGGFGSTAATDADNTARYSFVSEQCDAAFTAALAIYGSGNPQTAHFANECASLAFSLRKMQDVERYLTHAANIYVKYFGEEEYVSKEALKQLSIARSILDKK